MLSLRRIAGNQTLRAALTIAPPQVNECMVTQGNKTIDQIQCDDPAGPGVAVELMQAIASQLPYKIMLHYVPGNDSWTDTLNSFERNETDVSLNFFTQNEARSTKVDFTSAAIFVKMVIAHHSNLKGDPIKFDVFYAPFDTVVWGCLFSAAMVIAFLFYIISRRHKTVCFSGSVSRRHTKTTTFRRSLWKMVMAFVEKGTDDYYNVHGAERPLTFAWAFFLLIMQSIYNSSLIYQFLSLPSAPFTSMDDLHSQLSSGKVRFITDTLNSRFLSDVRNTKLPEYVKLKDFFTKNPPELYPSDDMWAMVGSTDNSITDDNSFTVNIQIRRSACNLSSTNNLIKTDLWYAFLLPKGSRYQRDFSNAIMQTRGLIARIEEKYRRPRCPQDSLTSKNVKVENVAGVCCILAVGALFGLICLTVENVHYYMRYKYKFLTWGKQAHFNPPVPVATRRFDGTVQELRPERRKKFKAQQHQEMIAMNNAAVVIPKHSNKLSLSIECTDCGKVVEKLDARELEDVIETNAALRQRFVWKMENSTKQNHDCSDKDHHHDATANGFVYTIQPPTINIDQFYENNNTYLSTTKNGHVHKFISAPVTPRANGSFSS